MDNNFEERLKDLYSKINKWFEDKKLGFQLINNRIKGKLDIDDFNNKVNEILNKIPNISKDELLNYINNELNKKIDILKFNELEEKINEIKNDKNNNSNILEEINKLNKRFDDFEEKLKIKDKWRFFINKLDYYTLIGEYWSDNCNFEYIREQALNYINYRTRNVLLKYGDQGLCEWQVNLLKQILALLMQQICCEGIEIIDRNNVSSESLGGHSKTYIGNLDSVKEIIKRMISDLNLNKYVGGHNCGGCQQI